MHDETPAAARHDGAASPPHPEVPTPLSDCPQCRAPAEILARWVFESTDGPLEHVKVACVFGHWFAMPTWMLTSM